MAIVLTRKPVDLTGWHLADQSEMLDALGYLSAQGWRGAVTFDSANNTWRLELNADQPVRQIIAVMGDWLIVDMGVRKLTDAEAAANYEELGS